MNEQNDVEFDKMRNALSGIANEMQKFNNVSLSLDHNEKCESEEILNKLIKCKASLGLRKMQIKKLRQNLKTACAVAKTMSAAKATETTSLTNHLDLARNQYLELVQQQNDKDETISKLNAENVTLRDQLQHFKNVIQLGYEELQKIRNERISNISALEQLKHIIVCCGQYYADHCNEHERCSQLEQKNRFLNNKILIMENNLGAASEELRNLRISIKPYKDKKEKVTSSRQCFGVVCSEYQIGPNHSSFRNLTMTKIGINKQVLQEDLMDLDLSSHLNTVKKLLDDQDDLIKDLKILTKVLINEESFME